MANTIIQTHGLSKTFQRRKAVDDLNLCVNEGDIYGFLGPNGAGKSTTIRMLTGLVRPDGGSASLLDFDIQSRRVQALRRVGALVESPALYKYLSARKNLEILARLTGPCERSRIDRVLEIVGLKDRAEDKVKTFSHGMKQRLGIGQALLPNPRLVILDEPTNGLDPQGMRDVRELILRLSREEKVTVFISSHLLHEVEQVCTRVGIVNRGKLMAEGRVEDLLHGDSDLIEFTVTEVDRAIGVLSAIEGAQVLGASAANISNKRTVAVRTSCDRISALNRALVEANIAVYGIAPRGLSLEDFFLQLVEGANGN
jgi:ABC-2 type transport system ATP-binding protein